ncbi:MAG: T9SS type A sorting domain-containing protein [Bacteroidales bacterium]|nr:T9SS type A sorting domain-containing protein [Bacteroidales bacterium]
MKNTKFFFNFTLLILLGILILFKPLTGIAQQAFAFEKNIKLPDSATGSSFIIDIVYSNGNLFTYTPSGVLVFDEDSLNFITKISFPPMEQYGKYNPQYFDKRLWLDDMNIMAVKGTGEQAKIFIITPDLNIMRIDAAAPFENSIVINRSDSLDSFKPMHGSNIIKYDNFHDRLYWMINARNPVVNCTGNFHVRDRYFAIYDCDNNNNLTLYYDDLKHASSDTSEYRDNGIFDIEFNHSNNYFYLAKLNRLEIWEIVSDTGKKVDKLRTINVYGYYTVSDFYKFGKMLYVKNDSIGIHKIIALPYRFPSMVLQENKTPKIFVIDGDGHADSVSVQQLDSPSKKILDGIFLPASQDLIVSYAPDISEIIQPGISDIAVYHYNSITDSFDTIPTTFSTDHADSTGPFDINSSFRLLPFGESKVLVSKKDEIVKLDYTNGNYSNAQILSGESNFYMRSVEGPSGLYVINPVNNGLEAFNKTPNHEKSIRSSFPAYHIAANNTGEKLYLFNKLSTHNTGVSVYNTANDSIINLNADTDQGNDIESPVGDCIFNPYKGQFLVSENTNNGNNPAEIKILNAADNSLDSTILLVDESGNNAQYAKEMFIAEDGNLYVATNMLVDLSEDPKIFVFDAASYQLIRTFNVTVSNPNYGSEYYVSHFCYSREDTNAYATVFGQEYTFDPYNTEYNSFIGFSDSLGIQTGGALVRLSSGSDSIISPGLGVKPGKILAPFKEGSNGNNASQFSGEMFIVSKTLYTYDIYQGAFQNTSHPLNDIVYNHVDDEIYGFSDEQGADCSQDRKAVFYKIGYNVQKQLEFTVIGQYLGQISSLFFNPYDRLLYVHTKFDNNKLGANPSKVLVYDPADSSNYYKGSVNLNSQKYPQNRSYYPEIDHNSDMFYFLYNLTTPYINPYTNKIYLPNGGHSHVSVVGFEARETLTLRASEDSIPGITWLSIPRHIRLTTPELTPTDTVFNENKISGDLIYLNIEYNYIDETNPAGGENLVHADWDPNTGWGYDDPVMQTINSTRGYIVKHRPNETKTLTMYGSVEDPNASMDLYCKKDNWIGYFLYGEQNVFDALAGIIDSIYHIQHQDYNCWRYNFPVSSECATKSQTDYSPGTWVCNGKSPTIKYGEMIMVKPLGNIYGFQWNQSGYPPGQETTQGATYYTYQEEARYSTFVIELDSAGENPQEIGAFVNDTCVGASRVETIDSVVVLSAYLGSRPGDSVVFENYYGPAKSVGMKIKDYYVRTPFESQKVKRAIKTGGKPGVYIISFSSGNKEPELPVEGGLAFDVYPNPASGSLFYSLTLNDNAFVYISVTDITGKLVVEPLSENMQAGTVSGKITLKAFSGDKLKPGIYLLRVKAGHMLETKKVIVK